MRILLLSPYADKLRPVFDSCSDIVIVTEDVFTPEFLIENKIDMGVSYGYPHILKKNVLDICPFINLHISYLPWNRGADPNIWSWIDGTPKGVTIHYIDEGIDTGDIIAQRELEMRDEETVGSSYTRLQEAIVGLFGDVWPLVRSGDAPRLKQEGGGSLHYVRDRSGYEHLMRENGYDTLAHMLEVSGGIEEE